MLEDGGLVQHLQVSFPKELLGMEIQSVGSGFGIVYKVTLMRMLELGSLSVAIEVSSKKELYSALGVLQAQMCMFLPRALCKGMHAHYCK